MKNSLQKKAVDLALREISARISLSNMIEDPKVSNYEIALNARCCYLLRAQRKAAENALTLAIA